ncbi:MAG: fasciclin domain-containing protein [Sphaerospermopsis sp. SIO1G2]|nr:fasciclin domain-containing protein [Sphaerospermopsis sp. SIO1G2]
MAPVISHAGNYNKGHTSHHAQHKAQASIVDIAAANENFSTLVAALKAADLVGALQSNGPFTVFAPTNAAFAKLPKGTLDDLLKPQNKAKLQAILKYHVVPSAVPAKVASGDKNVLTTLEGGKLFVDGTSGGVQVENANVVKADIKGSNGIIHVIDMVLLP